MKKATLLLYILLISISSILLTNKYDLDDSSKYFLFEPSLQLKIPEIDGLSKSSLDDLIDNISEGSYLKKTYFRSGYNATFINLESYDELSVYLNSIGIKNELTGTCSEFCFISSYQSEDEKQLGIAPDFMNNHNYRFYLMKDMADSGYALFGDYELISVDKNSDQKFIQNMVETGAIKGQLVNYSSPVFSNISKVIEKQISSFIFIIIVIFISTTIYDYYKHARRISILKMLGYSNRDIFFELGFLNLILVITTQFIVVATIVIVIGTKDFNFFTRMLVFYCVINILYLVVSYLIMTIMNRKLVIFNALRNQSLTSTLVSVSMIVKLFIGVLLLTSSFSSFNRIDRTYRDYVAGLKFESVFNISRFYGYIRNEVDDAEFSRRSVKFYEQLASQDNIEYVLANFIEYYPLTNPSVYYEGMDKDTMENDLLNYTNGLNFPMGEVDRNYLKKFNVEVYDESGELLNLDNKLYEYSIIIPESNRANFENIKKFSESYSAPASFQRTKETEYPIVYYFYEDQSLPSLDPKINPSLSIDSPILYVIDTPTILEFEEGGTLILGGDSSVKFFQLEKESKTDLYKKIEPLLINNDLQDFVDLSQFISYGDEYGQVSNLALIEIYNDSMYLFVILLFYFIISMQMNKLQFESDLQDIAVKKYLGYKNLDSFSNLVTLNLTVLLMTFLASIIIYILTGHAFSTNLIIPLVLVGVIDFIGVAVFIHYLKKKNLTVILKGDN